MTGVRTRDAAPPSATVVVRAGGSSVVVRARTLVVGAVLVLALVGVAGWGLFLGDYPMSVGTTLDAVFGRASDPLANHFVRELRAPRVVAAITVGVALGISGGLLQEVTGNPLGSPDIVGFTVGSASGALLALLVFGGGPWAASAGAFVGGLATAVLVHAVASRHGVSVVRIVLVGIGVSLMCQSLNTLLLVRADLSGALTAAQWLAGSFNAMTWTKTLMLLVGVVAVLPAVAYVSRGLTLMSLGDDVARGLGVTVDRHRFAIVFLSVTLAALATATAGPIAFIALSAPQIGRRLTRSPQAGLVVAGLTGALVVLTSDVAAQRVFAPTHVPVGVVSGCVGGVYLMWLLAREWRRV